MSKKNNIYISLDHETDGPCSGINNMLTFGAASFQSDGHMISTFYRRIIELPYLKPSTDTMIWWRKQNPEAYKEAFDKDAPGVTSVVIVSKPRITAYDTMLELQEWLLDISATVSNFGAFVPIAWPASFDFSFTNWYCHKFLGKNPLGYACLDIRSYLMGLMRMRGYHDIKEEKVSAMFGDLPDRTGRPHIAVDDAVIQGKLFFHVLNHPLASVDLIKIL